MDVKNKPIALLAIALPIIFGSIYAYAHKADDDNKTTIAQISTEAPVADSSANFCALVSLISELGLLATQYLLAIA